MNNDEDQAYKKVSLCIQEVQGRSCLTDFHGLTLTRDKLNSLMCKWHTVIEAHEDVKTMDGYVARLFVIAFTERRQDQVKTDCYAQTAQVRKIRKKMVEGMTKEAGTVQLREPVNKLILESSGPRRPEEAKGQESKRPDGSKKQSSGSQERRQVAIAAARWDSNEQRSAAARGNKNNEQQQAALVQGA